jgi:hypothetical protein
MGSRTLSFNTIAIQFVRIVDELGEPRGPIVTVQNNFVIPPGHRLWRTIGSNGLVDDTRSLKGFLVLLRGTGETSLSRPFVAAIDPDELLTGGIAIGERVIIEDDMRGGVSLTFAQATSQAWEPPSPSKR